VLVGGGLLIVGVLGTWTVATGHRRCALGRADAGWTPRLAWAPLTVAAGGRLAFGRGEGRVAGPMRSAMVGIALGTIGAIGATFVLVSLDDVVDDPARWGIPWDGQVTNSDPSQVGDIIDRLGEDDLVDAAAVLEAAIVQAGGEELSGYAFTPPSGDIAPTVRRGRLPQADDEVALGEQSMEDLDVEIGDTLTVDGATDEDDETDEPDVDLVVVGAVVLPTYNDPKPALGSVLTPDGLDRVRRGESLRFMLVDFEDDVDEKEGEAHLLDEYGLGLLGPILPPQLTNLDEARTVIDALIVFFVALAFVGLLQALALSRRRQVTTIAVWRALGFVPRQVRRSVLWQSALVTLVAVGIGVPVGLYVGQVAWRLATQSLGVMDDPSLPVIPAVLALPSALVAAVLLALFPGWLAARGEPARDLRAE
jgi:FtsX-like permease family